MSDAHSWTPVTLNGGDDDVDDDDDDDEGDDDEGEDE